MQLLKTCCDNLNLIEWYTIDSFNIKIFQKDSCKPKEYKNISTIIGDENRQILKGLESGDVIIFNSIYATGPGGQRELVPMVLAVY